MDEDNARELLDQLAECEDRINSLVRDKDSSVKASLTPEEERALKTVADREAEYVAEMKPLFDAARETEAKLRLQIQKAIVELGRSVKGGRKTGVFVKGRSAVDVKGLEGYGKAHPEVLDFITTGDPSVTIRNNPKAGEGMF